MTVWIHEIGDGEYTEAAVVENGSVVSGDEGLVTSAFPEGIPEDEAEVARAFKGPATIASTDFDMEWTETPEWAEGVEMSGGAGFFRCLGGVTDRDVANAPEWDRPLLEMYQGVTDPESDPSRTLVSFASSGTPEFVLERIREAIMSGALFSDIDGISGDRMMDFRQEFADSLAQDDFTLDDVTETVMEFTGEDRDAAEVAARTELGNTLKAAREDGYTERGEGDERFYWTGADPGDPRQTDCCGYLIAGEGGHLDNPGAFSGLDHPQGTNPFEGGEPLPMDELKELVQQAARADPEINTEPRTWTPHIQCRSTFVLEPSEGI